MTGMGLVSWLWRPVGGLREIGWGDVALAAFLSLYAIVVVSGLSGIANPHSGAAAAVAVLAMTVPVAWERRAPAAAAAAVAVGAAANELVIGPMIRCGPGLPAVFVIAFFAGTRLERAQAGRRRRILRRRSDHAGSCMTPGSAPASSSPGCQSLRRAVCGTPGAVPRPGSGGPAGAERGTSRPA